MANVVLLSEIPTTYDKRSDRQVNAGNLLLRGVPGVGKTFFGVILSAISDAKFARIQGRADLQPTEVVGFQMINPSTGQLVTEFGPMASAEVILLDEINRIPLKSQSAFLEALQDRTITVGKSTYDLPSFSFAIATMNPVELGQGTFPLSEAATDRFAVMVNIGYLPPDEEEKLVNFDFKQVRLNPLLSKQRIIELRARINQQVFLHERLGKYIQRLVAATRPFNPDTDWRLHSPSDLVERGVDLGASPRAIICWSRLAKVWALLQRGRAEVFPEDIQDLAPFVLGPSHLARTARRRAWAHLGAGHPRRHRSGTDSMRVRRAGCRVLGCECRVLVHCCWVPLHCSCSACRDINPRRRDRAQSLNPTPQPAKVLGWEPIRCWRQSSAGAIAIGEIFTVVLTCAVYEADNAQVIPDESRLGVASIQMAPFEILGGSHPPDVRRGSRRFFQYDYQLRIISRDAIGRDVNIPPLPISYRIHSRVGAAATLEGRDLSYVMPMMPIKVLSLVPADAADIRDASEASLGAVESLRFRSSLFQVLALAFGALAAVMAVLALVPLARSRAATGGRERRPHSRSRGARSRGSRTCAQLQTQAGVEGWDDRDASPARSHPMRLIAAAAIEQTISQKPLDADGGVPDGRLLCEHGLIRQAVRRPCRAR